MVTVTVHFSEPYPREQKSVNYYIYKHKLLSLPFYPAEFWTVTVTCHHFHFTLRKSEYKARHPNTVFCRVGVVIYKPSRLFVKRVSISHSWERAAINRVSETNINQTFRHNKVQSQEGEREEETQLRELTHT